MVKVNMMTNIERRTFNRKVLEPQGRVARTIGFLTVAIIFSGFSFALVFVNLR